MFRLLSNRSQIRAVREAALEKLGASTSMNLPELRDSARQIWEAALDAANPATCIHNNLKIHDNVLSVGDRELRIDGKLIVIGAGKAASRMAQVVEEMLGDQDHQWAGRDQVRAWIAAAADSPG